MLCATLALTGCLRPPRAVPDMPEGEYYGRGAEPRHAAFLDERVPEQVRIQYESSFSRGIPVTPLLQDDMMVTVVSGGAIAVASAESGDRYWSRRFNGAIAGRALRVGNRLILATHHRKGGLVALDIRRGRRSWDREFDGRAAAEPVHHRGVIYLATDRGELFAVDATTGAVQWQARIGRLVEQPPLALTDEIIVAARDTLYRVAAGDGTVVARHAIAAAPTAPLAAAGDTIIVATQDGVVVAYSGRGAREIWRQDTGAPVLAAPVVAEDGVWVLNRQAEVWRLTATSAERVAALEGTATESLTLTAGGLVVGTLDGVVTYMRRDGSIVWQEKVRGSVRAPVAVHQGAVYVPTLAGRIVKLAP